MDKHKLLKKVLIIILIVAAAVFFLDWAWGKYKFWQATKEVDKLAQALRDIEKKDYEMAMADTFGGQTPEETLALFIKAVEAGDYDLASKYFIIPKQEEWRGNLTNTQNIDEFLSVINNARTSEGEYSEDEKSFSIYRPVLIKFLLYPNGVWKIVEI